MASRDPTLEEVYRLYVWALDPKNAICCCIRHMEELIPCRNSEIELDRFQVLQYRKWPCVCVHICAMIVGVRTREKKTEYFLDDGTGIIEMWCFGQVPLTLPSTAQGQAGVKECYLPPHSKNSYTVNHVQSPFQVGDVVYGIGRIMYRAGRPDLLHAVAIERTTNPNSEHEHLLRAVSLAETLYATPPSEFASIMEKLSLVQEDDIQQRTITPPNPTSTDVVPSDKAPRPSRVHPVTPQASPRRMAPPEPTVLPSSLPPATTPTVEKGPRQNEGPPASTHRPSSSPAQRVPTAPTSSRSCTSSRGFVKAVRSYMTNITSQHTKSPHVPLVEHAVPIFTTSALLVQFQTLAETVVRDKHRRMFPQGWALDAHVLQSKCQRLMDWALQSMVESGQILCHQGRYQVLCAPLLAAHIATILHLKPTYVGPRAPKGPWLNPKGIDQRLRYADERFSHLRWADVLAALSLLHMRGLLHEQKGRFQSMMCL